MMRFGRFRFFALLSTLAVALTMVSVDYADARRGGSFGSRGTRTFQTPAPTRTAPDKVAPVERSMTPAPAPGTAARQQTVTQRPSFFNGFGGSLMRGLLLGGLIGMLLGYGFGGFAGLLGFALQALLLVMLASLALAYFRSRQTPAAASGAPYGRGDMFGSGSRRDAADGAAAGRGGGFSIPRIGGAASTPESADLAVDQADLDTFERRLAEVQAAFSQEDHAALRRLTTPEMVSFLSEELADNARKGVRNDVSDVHLVQADVAEAWREDGKDYATAAFRYESIDVLRDRATSAIVGGREELTETVELWTFVRHDGEDWKLSAIQEA